MSVVFNAGKHRAGRKKGLIPIIIKLMFGLVHGESWNLVHNSALIQWKNLVITRMSHGSFLSNIPFGVYKNSIPEWKISDILIWNLYRNGSPAQNKINPFRNIMNHKTHDYHLKHCTPNWNLTHKIKSRQSGGLLTLCITVIPLIWDIAPRGRTFKIDSNLVPCYFSLRDGISLNSKLT